MQNIAEYSARRWTLLRRHRMPLGPPNGTLPRGPPHLSSVHRVSASVGKTLHPKWHNFLIIRTVSWGEIPTEPVSLSTLGSHFPALHPFICSSIRATLLAATWYKSAFLCFTFVCSYVCSHFSIYMSLLIGKQIKITEKVGRENVSIIL